MNFRIELQGDLLCKRMRAEKRAYGNFDKCAAGNRAYKSLFKKLLFPIGNTPSRKIVRG